MDDPKYTELARVLNQAYGQASNGKGKERHANNEPFEDQLICLLDKLGASFTTGQAIKKILESHRLESMGSPGIAISELLGAINYISARILVIEKRMENGE